MPEKIVRIAFRGLMVFNYQTNAATGRRFVEIGFLDARTGSAPGGSHVHTPASSAIHIPRVLTTENGLLADVLDLRKFPGLLGAVREWRLVPVGTPLQPEVTLKGTGPADRKIPPTDDNREDFGWIINLEGADMHATNLTREISTAKLLMVLKVENGEFSTKLISPFLNRQEKGDSEARPFGFSAAVTGLDIKCEVANAEDEGAVDLFA
ncbi:MAG: hypothetical protein ACXW3C_02630, partial [Pyrinomonadaceae bacterium]